MIISRHKINNNLGLITSQHHSHILKQARHVRRRRPVSCSFPCRPALPESSWLRTTKGVPHPRAPPTYPGDESAASHRHRRFPNTGGVGSDGISRPTRRQAEGLRPSAREGEGEGEGERDGERERERGRGLCLAVSVTDSSSHIHFSHLISCISKSKPILIELCYYLIYMNIVPNFWMNGYVRPEPAVSRACCVVPDLIQSDQKVLGIPGKS